MTGGEQELIERYIYQVTRRLPKDQRDDVALELGEMIGDMIEGKGSTAEKVLTELGDPARLAEQYQDVTHCLIGPEYYDTYLWFVKVVLLCSILPVLAAGVVDAVRLQGAGAGECAGRYATTGQSQITAIDIQYRACSTVQFTGSLAVAVHVQLGISSQANFTGLSQSTVAVHEDLATANICYSCVSIFRRQNQRTFTSFSQRFSIPARR